jgi:hypothetical protein
MPSNTVQQIKESLRAFGLNPQQWRLGRRASAAHPWVIFQNRQDQNYCLAGRWEAGGIKELHLLPLF